MQQDNGTAMEQDELLFKALLARLMFAIHGIITVLRVTDVNANPLCYLLSIPVFLLPFELIHMQKSKGGEEWKCVLLYIFSVAPGIWLLNFDVYQKRIENRDSMGWEDCSMMDIQSYNTSSLNADEVAGVKLPLALSDESWTLALEQFLLALLLSGRWLLSKKSLKSDEQSLQQIQLLLMYIMMAADTLEFSFETLRAQPVICNRRLIFAILSLWSLSLLQFSFCFLCCKTDSDSEQRVSWIALISQDCPFLVMRLYLLIQYRIINQMILFFTLKNLLVIFLQSYLILRKCSGNKVSPDNGENEGQKKHPRK